MKKIMMTMLSMAALPLFANTPPEITNVRASQRENTKLVDIYYDAADSDGDLLKVRIEISDNDGLKYSVPAFSLTGDIGEGIAVGTNKHIVWDAGTDWDGEYSDKMRVKVYAIDAQGFPGLEWGNEVPPGGFLMGQDGGAEGSGPSRHVNIPWSYWLSKYEITAEQYCEFLNAALSVGYVKLSDTTEVRAASAIPLDMVSMDDSVLCQIGDAYNIRWNVNRFEPSSEAYSNLPVVVTWNGAIAFARFYGYDLPTEAEWEKAARGPDNDDANEHSCYPWGDEVSVAYANIVPQKGLNAIGFYNGNQTPVGPDTANGYGLYDVIGNVVEWTLSSDSDNASILDYPQQESLTNVLHMPYNAIHKIVRGYRDRPLYHRKSAKASSQLLQCLTGYSVVSSYYSSQVTPNYASTDDPVGFRVARRNSLGSVKARRACFQDFSEWDLQETTSIQNLTNNDWVVGYTSSTWGGVTKIVDGGVDDTRCVLLCSDYSIIVLPKTTMPVVTVRTKVKGSSNSLYYVYVCSVMPDGTEKTCSYAINDNGKFLVHAVSLSPDPRAEKVYLKVTNGSVYFDDIELVTTFVE